jgi:lambda family phage portal protein
MTAHNAAAQDDARMTAWVPPCGSADADLIDELSSITPRARDMVRNNPLASGARQTYCDNIIGSQLRLSSQPRYRLLSWEKERASEWANNTEAQFATWAETTECDAARTQTLLGLTIQALSGAMVNGDSLALFNWQPRNGEQWSTRIQTVEADRLATPPWLMADKNVRGGVKINKFNAPLGYWILKNHPGDQFAGFLPADQSMWTYVPAFTSWGRRQVIHLFDKERSGQSRGKSVFTAVMRDFRIAGEYMGAELHAAVINAMIAAFLETDLDPQSVGELFGNDPDGKYWKEVSEKWNRKKMDSGIIQTLPLGTKLSGYDPNRPNTAFDGFMESVLRQLAAGLNMPYELLLKDFSKTNYSSARASLLEAWRYFNSRRRWLKEQWLDPIYETWMEEAVNGQRIEADNYYDQRFAYGCCRWVFSGRGFVDPVKEPKGSEIKMSIGLSTQQDECAEQGKDYQDVQDQRVRELQEAAAKVKAANLPPEAAYYIAGFVPSKVQLDATEDEETGEPKQEQKKQDEENANA